MQRPYARVCAANTTPEKGLATKAFCRGKESFAPSMAAANQAKRTDFARHTTLPRGDEIKASQPLNIGCVVHRVRCAALRGAARKIKLVDCVKATSLKCAEGKLALSRGVRVSHARLTGARNCNTQKAFARTITVFSEEMVTLESRCGSMAPATSPPSGTNSFLSKVGRYPNIATSWNSQLVGRC